MSRNSEAASTGGEFIITFLWLGTSLVAQLVKNLPAIQETLVWFLGGDDYRAEGIGYPLQYSWAFPVAQLVKNPPSVQETWVCFLGWEDALEKGKAIHSSILAWRIPRTVAHQAPLSMGILQARILEWIAFPFSRASSQPRDWTQVSCIAGRFFTSWAIREAPDEA